MKVKYSVMLKALLNELAVDEFSMKKSKLDRQYSFTILRPYLFMSKNPKIVTIVLKLLTFSWVVVYPILMFVKLIKYVWIFKGKKERVKLNEEIFIATTIRVIDSMSRIDSKRLPLTVLEVPWVNINKLEGESKIVNIKNFISIKLLIKTLFEVFKGNSYWKKNITSNYDVLQTYILFEFFLLYNVLDNLSHKRKHRFWFSNHYDRWAVLFDSFGDNNITLVQHGIIDENFNLPSKLNNIKTIYAFSQRYIDIFKNNIINSEEGIEYLKLNSMLKLNELELNEPSILIIGIPYLFEREKIIIAEIQKRLNIQNIFIKPHPRYELSIYEEYFSKFGVEIIREPALFPKVNVVLTGQSTLGLEYESMGIKVIWYEDLDIENLLKEVSVSLSISNVG